MRPAAAAPLHTAAVLCSWVKGKQWYIKINYLCDLTSPLRRKFHTDFKNSLKKTTYEKKRYTVDLLIEILREMTTQFFKNCIGKAGLNLNR
jgi:hypothetical protein